MMKIEDLIRQVQDEIDAESDFPYLPSILDELNGMKDQRSASKEELEPYAFRIADAIIDNYPLSISKIGTELLNFCNIYLDDNPE